MKELWHIGIVVVILFLLTSCATGVSQADLDKVNSSLANAQTQIQSLQADLAKGNSQISSLQSNIEAIKKKGAEALVYAEFLDILMYPANKRYGITPRLSFKDDVEWMVALMNKTKELKDDKVSEYVERVKKNDSTAMGLLWDYCLDKIEKALR